MELLRVQLKRLMFIYGFRVDKAWREVTPESVELLQHVGDLDIFIDSVLLWRSSNTLTGKVCILCGLCWVTETVKPSVYYVSLQNKSTWPRLLGLIFTHTR